MSDEVKDFMGSLPSELGSGQMKYVINKTVHEQLKRIGELEQDNIKLQSHIDLHSGDCSSLAKEADDAREHAVDLQLELNELAAEGIAKPATLLPDCKWQGHLLEKPSVTICFKAYMEDRVTRHKGYMQPCPKQCICPEKGE